MTFEMFGGHQKQSAPVKDTSNFTTVRLANSYSDSQKSPPAPFIFAKETQNVFTFLDKYCIQSPSQLPVTSVVSHMA